MAPIPHIRMALTGMLLFLFGCGGTGSKPDPQVVKLYGGEAGYGLLSERPVEAVRLKMLVPDGSGDPQDYEPLGDVVTLSDEQSAKLEALLKSPDAYLWDVAKACEPIYGVRLEIEAEGHRLEIYLCLQCELLLVTLDGKTVGGEDFDNIGPELIQLMKDLFPGDADIQEL
ncbi:MAG: hypothetical protein KDA88_12775 [Planctomycetaceae bacterium]|nr:hypothetical protein [Planctomycetaceae bacterium]MCB9954027.1 hypothetical protein [Planctomycetaceae bacterium]